MRSKLPKKCYSFFKNETVLCISAVCALLSCCLVPPDAEYFSYIDWDTLALLFSLMAVMKGFQEANFFACMANRLLQKIASTRTMLLILVFSPFLFSMVITNDVALIAFVPFSLTILKMAGQERLTAPLVALQTIAANLGSMLTPMGNPQNLYLYYRSGIDVGTFCGLMLPYVLASAICLILVIIFLKPTSISGISLSAKLGKPGALWCYAAGFALCLLGVFKVFSPVVIASVTAVFLMFYNRKLLAAIDYSLLGTFLALFIFIGNVARIEWFQDFLVFMIEGRVEVISILASQIISNVPASILLSGFTSQWQSLIIGCNLGGLGTLIASMASLISYKMVVKACPEQRKHYFQWFTVLNVCFLAFLFLLSSCIQNLV